MDLYRRIADLTPDAPSDPERTERARRTVEGSLTSATADRLGLSGQDLEIIDLLAQGCSNREIGRSIHLSPHTVKDRLSKLMTTFGARTRAEVCRPCRPPWVDRAGAAGPRSSVHRV